MKRKLERGITLIALIITIIILLILAAVGLTMLTGENGILNRATEATETNEIKTAEEKVKLAVMASYGNDGKIDLVELQKNISKIEGITNAPESISTGDTILTVDGKDIKVNVDENRTAVVDAIITKTGTLSKIITAEDYGKTINYSVTVNETTLSDWKVFYNDGTNVYIILSDYLDNSLIPSTAGITKGDKYHVWWESSQKEAVQSLTSTEVWNEFANGVQGATAIGGPTNEMFVNSWNENPSTNTRLLEASSSAYNLTDSTGLYIPHTTIVENCKGYWLASGDTNGSVWYVSYSGLSSTNYWYYSFIGNAYGIRPVVCLTNNVSGTVGDAITIE